MTGRWRWSSIPRASSTGCWWSPSTRVEPVSAEVLEHGVGLGQDRPDHDYQGHRSTDLAEVRVGQGERLGPPVVGIGQGRRLMGIAGGAMASRLAALAAKREHHTWQDHGLGGWTSGLGHDHLLACRQSTYSQEDHPHARRWWMVLQEAATTGPNAATDPVVRSAKLDR